MRSNSHENSKLFQKISIAIPLSNLFFLISFSPYDALDPE